MYRYTILSSSQLCTPMAPSRSEAAYDQDKYGWVMVFALFVCNAVVYGNLKALGILIIPMTNDLDSKLWLVGWIAVFYGIMNRCMGPVVGAVSRLLSMRRMTVFGALIGMLGFVLTSVSTSVSAVAVFIIGLSGVGSAFSIFTSSALMASYFKDNYPLAVGISTIGIPLGIMAYGPVTQVLLDTYGWRGAMLLLGGFSFHLVACALLMRQNPASSSSADAEEYQRLPSVSDEEEETGEGKDVEGVENDSDSDSWERRAKQSCWNVLKAIDLGLLSDARFLLLVFARCTVALTHRAWVVYMVPHGQFQGLGATQASFLPTSFGVGSAVGKFIVIVSQIMGVKRSLTFWSCFGASMLSLSLLLDAFVKPFIGQLAVTLFVGIAMAVMFQGIDVMMRFLKSDDWLISVLGWQGMFVDIAGILGGLISGWVFEWTGSFSIALCIFSGIILISIPLFLAEAYIHRANNSQNSVNSNS